MKAGLVINSVRHQGFICTITQLQLPRPGPQLGPAGLVRSNGQSCQTAAQQSEAQQSERAQQINRATESHPGFGARIESHIYTHSIHTRTPPGWVYWAQSGRICQTNKGYVCMWWLFHTYVAVCGYKGQMPPVHTVWLYVWSPFCGCGCSRLNIPSGLILCRVQTNTQILDPSMTIQRLIIIITRKYMQTTAAKA